MNDEDLSELHIPATYAVAAGVPMVSVDPRHVIELIDEIRRLRSHAASKATGGEPIELSTERERRIWREGLAAGAAQRSREVGEVLAANGCNCDCDHSHDEHDGDCERCLACRVGDVIGGPADAEG